MSEQYPDTTTLSEPNAENGAHAGGGILRFITAGSVDDGKSTLIGRLLYDSKSILADQLEALERSTKGRSDGDVDLALLTDGLRAEREQGITIDVAYRYFATPQRKFIVADAPGHVQYTRNMITGASNADLMVVLIDARQGMIEQTRRHSLIASQLRLKGVVVAINKMDLVNYDEAVFDRIREDYEILSRELALPQAQYIPISALQGDNIVNLSQNMPWYKGLSLLHHLERFDTATNHDSQSLPARFGVQYVIRPQTAEWHDYRGYAGKVISGSFRPGDAIQVMPAGIEAVIKSIEVGGVPALMAEAPQSAVFQLETDVDVSRGDVMAPVGALPKVGSEIEATLCWLDEKPLQPGNKYILQHGARRVRAMVRTLHQRTNVNTLEKEPVEGVVKLNEVVSATLKLAAPLPYDAFDAVPANGGAILIDETGNGTVAAVMLH